MQDLQSSKALGALSKAINATAEVHQALVELQAAMMERDEGIRTLDRPVPVQECIQRYEIPQSAKPRECKGCKATIYFVVTANGKTMPVDVDGYPHWERCANPDRFRKE